MFGMQRNTRFWHGGLGLVAALMLTTAALAQDAAPEGDDRVMAGVDLVVDDGSVQNWHDLAPDDGGIAIDEPAPTDGTDPVEGDGGDQTGDPANDGSDVGVDDGSGDEVWIDDGSGDGVDDGWVDDGSGDDGWVDDGTDGGVDDGTDGGTGTDGSDDGVVPGDDVTIYNMDGGPERCIDCDVGLGDLPPEAYQMSAGGPIVAPADAPVAHKANRPTTHGLAMSAMHECLVLHPQAAWICEWQNGAGQ